jgi:RHS repeat-associated protein
VGGTGSRPLSLQTSQGGVGMGGGCDENTPEHTTCPPNPPICTSEHSSEPIRYATGEILIVVTDLASNAFGQPGGYTRSWSNRLGVDYGGPYGVNWFLKEAPMLVQDGPNMLALVGVVQKTLWFDLTSGVWGARFQSKDTLEHDATNQKFIHTDFRGKRTEFHDFTVTAALQGKFIRSVDAHGGAEHVTEAQYDGSNRLESLTQSATGLGTVSYEYAYHNSGVQINRLISVTLQVNSENVRRASFEYYDWNEDHGVIGDLKRVTIETWQTPCPSGSAAWATVQNTGYRYYVDDTAPGFTRGLKYVVNPDAYARMVAASLNPDTATDAQMAAYADHYFEYDGLRRVTKEKTKGGLLTYLFSYTPSENTPGLNTWNMKTVETLPDGNTNTVYTNYAGQVILKIVNKTGTGQSWYDYYHFDNKGRMDQHANSSAVASFSEGSPGLVTLKTAEGLIHVTEYYPDNATGTGEAPGYTKYQKRKQGSGGTPVITIEMQYEKRTAADGSITYPLWKKIVYPNDTATGLITTEYERTWFSGTQQVEELTIKLPPVPVAQNGANVTDTRKQKFSTYGQLLWEQDERGYITGYTYDPLNGALIQRIDDAGSSASPPWTPVSGTRLNLITTFTNDALGRQVQELGPEHEIDLAGTATMIRRARWTVYQDVTHEVWQAGGYASGGGFATFTLVQPVNLLQLDPARRVTARLQAVRGSGTSGKLDRCDSFPQSSWSRWTQFHYDQNGRLDWQRVYSDIPSSGSGTSGTNYDQTSFGYNSMLRRNKLVTPGGTITKVDFNAMGWMTARHVGTNDSGGGSDNMVQTEELEYDGGSSGGDGNLTKRTLLPEGLGGPERVTDMTYDWRNRLETVTGEEDFFEKYTSDNFNRLIKTERREGNISGDLGWIRENKIDTRGRVYRRTRQGTAGGSGPTLEDNYYFDAAGNMVRTHPSGSEAFFLISYDSLNRPIVRYMAYGPGNLSGDTVMEQSELIYDKASNLIQETIRERFHDATGTGALTTPGGSPPKARVSYLTIYPEALGRIVNVANYGTNGDTALSRPATCPARSATVLVSTTSYNDRGEVWQTTDPKSTVKRATFDDMGRLTQTIENYQSSGSGSDLNKTTNFTYTPDGGLATLTAINATTGNQMTTYLYGTTLTDSNIVTSNLLSAVVYPDSTDTLNPLSGSDHVSYAYNAVGERKKMRDQRGTVHEYEFDKLGRLRHDRVTTPGSGVNTLVRRVTRAYEFRGLLQSVKSYDNSSTSLGVVLNETRFTYNEFMQLSSDEQAHDNAVTGGTPAVGYVYADGSDNRIRPETLTYPSGRDLHFDYGSEDSMADKLSRVAALIDDDESTHLADYTYLGHDRTVQINFPEPGVKFTWLWQTGDSITPPADPYTGWDRFGRAIDLRWIKTSNDAELERLKHGYDEASNRLYRKNVVATALSAEEDQLYSYDGLYQLEDFQRGVLNGGNNGMGTLTAQEEMAFDPTGNWNSYTVDSGTPQTRTHNEANELTEIDSSDDLVGEDLAGNMTKVPQPGDWAEKYDLTYDAWNRLVKVADGETTVAEYAYDGLNRRIKKKIGEDTRHYYYSDQWQILEERVNASEGPDRQFVWGIRYIDDLILRDLTVEEENERLYVIQDYFQPTAMLDDAGNVLERYGYTAFGAPRVLDDEFEPKGDSDYEWETRYGAYRWDEETGLYQVRHRYLHSELGRWVRRDPIEYTAGDQNLYCYVKNSSINLVDPYGLQSWQLQKPAQVAKPTINTNTMTTIASNAMNQVGSTNWADQAQFGKYGPGVSKCNIFWASQAELSGARVPDTSGLFSFWPNNPPLAAQIADTNFNIPNWPVISGPMPGAVMSLGGHVGIVGTNGTSSISVYNGGYVTNNNWGFRTNQCPVFRGYTGP